MKQNKQYAEQLLDTLKELDRITHESYYEIGRLLYSFKNEKLFELLDYESFKQMVQEELSFSYNVAIKYANLYGQFRRLKYNRTEAIIAMEEFGVRSLAKVLPKTNEKLGVRALRHRVDALDEYNISFWMRGAEYDEVVAALEFCGVEYTDTGRFSNSSEALVAMARHVLAKAQKQAA